MTKTMRHIKIDGYGEPSVLKLVVGPRPDPAEGEVLIRVTAAGVNRPDCSQRRGTYPPPPGVIHRVIEQPKFDGLTPMLVAIQVGA